MIPNELAGLRFWVAGGHAIDMFVGRKTREHDDVDIVIDRRDQLLFQNALHAWDLQQVYAPAKLKPWLVNEFLESPVHAVWCRKQNEPLTELLLSEFTETEWIYRRDPNVRGPLEDFGWRNAEGLQVIAPEIQLLYKSSKPREKDTADLLACLPKLENKLWLKSHLPADHPWLDLL